MRLFTALLPLLHPHTRDRRLTDALIAHPLFQEVKFSQKEDRLRNLEDRLRNF